MSANGHPGSIAGEPSEKVLTLLPLIARVVDLGRGPPGLVRWVESRLALLGEPTRTPTAAHRRLILLRLARELSRQLRSNELTATVAVRRSHTIRIHRPGAK